MAKLLYFLLVLFCFVFSCSLAFQSDELLLDDEEFGLEGAKAESRYSEPARTGSTPPASTSTSRKRYSDSDSDSKIQFALDHAFGDSDFSPAGTFSARIKTWNHGGQTLTKLRFSRNDLSNEQKGTFERLLEEDDFYRIRLPSNVLSPPGREYVISSVRARCLPREGLDEHIIIHMDGVNVLAVNYGSSGACQYPRQLKLPSKWSFNSHTILKNSEQAPRTPLFTEEVLGGENAEGEIEKLPEKSFWAKYWMYAIPLGLIVMNAMTQAMNMAEEQPAGAQGQPAAAAIRGPAGNAVRRR